MIDDPPDVVEWRAYGALLKDVQARLIRVEERLEKQEETIKIGFQLLHEDLLNARSETRMAANRLKVVETTVHELEGTVRSMDGKLDLILNHLGLDGQ